MTIRIGRTVFVVLVALSVATLPTAQGFAAAVTTATEMSVSNAMPDCAHRHNVPSDKTQKTTDNGACMAACAVACFGFTAIGYSGIAFQLPIGTTLNFVRTSDNISSRLGSLPFRPPRA
jgi:hypothetical protein